YELARALGVQQKSAWFMLHRIRLAMKAGSIEKLGAEQDVEADETFIGGLSKNMHKHKREEIIKKPRGPAGKTDVMDIRERAEKVKKGGSKKGRKLSKVRATVSRDVKGDTLRGNVRENVKKGAELHTDAWIGYFGLDEEYVHHIIDHTIEYVNGKVH